MTAAGERIAREAAAWAVRAGEGAEDRKSVV